MIEGTGLAVFEGIAIGPAVVYRKASQTTEATCGTPQQEQIKFDRACAEAKSQLQSLYTQTKNTLGEQHAAIIEVQILMLEDPDYLESVAQRIATGISAAAAAENCGETLARLFDDLDDGYMKARAADIRDVSSRIAGILRGSAPFSPPEGDFILIAEDLAPSETVRLPRDRILGFLTQKGTASSHTAILARTLGIPTLVQSDVDLDAAEQCSVCSINSFTGQWFLDPDTTTLDALNRQQAQHSKGAAALEAFRGQQTVTKTGKRIRLFANIGSVEDAKTAVRHDAEGIGLLRSEFLYLGRDQLPTEDELFRAYRDIAAVMQGKPVIIRTLDIGADKQAPYFYLPEEENPALGLRGLRLCLACEDVFKVQIRAIYRASAFGNVHMMFPMVASLWELQEAKRICAEVRQELLAEGISVRDIAVGVMIETPAAALIAAELAKEARFFSVGTNDLTQYTLAIDRQNACLDRFYDPHHPAVLSLLEHIARCANDAGIWAGICGELGADPTLTDHFIKMGYAELSMSSGQILAARKRICESEV